MEGTITGPMLGGMFIRPEPLNVELQPVAPSQCVVSVTSRTDAQGRFSFLRLPATSYTLHVTVPDSLRVPAQDSARVVELTDGAVVMLAIHLDFAPRDTTLTFYVGPADAACYGPFPRRCLLVKEKLGDPYSYFYDSIGGFTWEPWYLYLLRVNRSRAPQVFADGSLYQWRLIQQLSKTPQ